MGGVYAGGTRWHCFCGRSFTRPKTARRHARRCRTRQAIAWAAAKGYDE